MRALVMVLATAIGIGGSAAQGLLGMEKKILPMTKANWVAFRDYDGKQWLYFTQLIVYRCGLSEIRYSINSDALDRRFDLPPCDPQRPNEVPAEDYPPYVTLPPGSADTVAVQLVYSDGEESEIVRFAPCVVAADGVCTRLLD